MTDPNNLRSLLERATPGPWRVREADGLYWTDALAIESDAGDVAATTRGWEGDGTEDNSAGCANAALIVEAVNALPALLAQLDSLAAENARLAGTLEALVAAVDRESPHIDSVTQMAWLHGCRYGGEGYGDELAAARAALAPPARQDGETT